jgi:hypothetical protein
MRASGRVGIGIFMLFLLKGLLWLVAPALLALASR